MRDRDDRGGSRDSWSVLQRSKRGLKRGCPPCERAGRAGIACALHHHNVALGTPASGARSSRRSGTPRVDGQEDAEGHP